MTFNTGASDGCAVLPDPSWRSKAYWMAAKDIIVEPYRKLAIVGVFHEAICGGEIAPRISSPTYFRIWKMPWVVDCVVVHATDSG
jgi:hypothetical protein